MLSATQNILVICQTDRTSRPIKFASSFNLTLQYTLHIACRSASTTERHTPHPPSSPPSSRNLVFNVTSSNCSDSSAVVRLQWDSPFDDGGAAITGYQIFVNSSLHQMVSNDTEATIVLNFIGEYFIQIRAINCIGVGHNLSTRINITGSDCIMQMNTSNSSSAGIITTMSTLIDSSSSTWVTATSYIYFD